MPRQPRLDLPGLVHHVMARGIEGQDIFRNDDDREAFLKRLSNGVDRPGGPQLYAWALMSTIHLLLRSGEGLFVAHDEAADDRACRDLSVEDILKSLRNKAA